MQRHDPDRDSARAAQKLVGRVLRDRWRVERLLGTGGMSSVYAATHRNGKRVAIKVLKPELCANSATRRRFLREGYIANRVNHAAVVSVLDDDVTDDGAAFLVMDLVEGETIESLRREHGGRLSPSEVVWIVEQLLDVLIAAHQGGIVHRDIKPDNVFLTFDGQIKLMDFGIARMRELSEFAEATHSGVAMGTPGYMAPEQARSRWDEVDARTDVWAVGATMFRLLSARPIHEAANSSEAMIAVATRPVPSLREICPELPASLTDVVDRALRLEKTERWESAQHMRTALSDARAQVPALAAPLLPTRRGAEGTHPERTEDESVWSATGNREQAGESRSLEGAGTRLRWRRAAVVVTASLALAAVGIGLALRLTGTSAPPVAEPVPVVVAHPAPVATQSPSVLPASPSPASIPFPSAPSNASPALSVTKRAQKPPPASKAPPATSATRPSLQDLLPKRR